MRCEFEIASSVERVGDDLYRAAIPDGWQQGRGTFGGLVLGILLRAIECSEPDRARAARTLSGDLCGPVPPGPADVRVRVLRRGSNQTNLAAELSRDGEVLATATAVLSLPRKAALPPVATAPPEPAGWQDAPIVPIGPPFGPVFAAKYEYRKADGAAFDATGRAIADGWIRERTPPERLDAPALVARLDAWWPSLYHVDAMPRLVATVSFTAEILADPAALPRAEPLRHRARTVAVSDGFFVELRELWHRDRLVGLNQQTFAAIR